jgi:polyhydroxyalkanoate synthesis regulator phasin
MLFETEIKQALKKAGLDESLFDQINVKTVEEIDGAVTTLKASMDKVKNLSKEELLEAVKKAGLGDAFNKILQSETDRKAAELLKKHQDEQKKAAEDEAAKKKAEEDQKNMTAEQKEIQALKGTIDELKETIAGITTNLSKSTLSSRIRAELTKQGLNEKFESNIVVSDPEKIADTVAGFKATFDEQQQATINEKLKAGELATVKTGIAGQTPDETKIAEYAKSIGEGGVSKNTVFQGKISSADSAAKTAAKT